MCLKACWFSPTDANAITGRSEMHVISTAQARQLLQSDADAPSSLLDVGAGSGNVTDHLRPLFSRVVVTEVSAPMCRWLRARGYTCHHTAEVQLPTVWVLLVSCGSARCRLRCLGASALMSSAASMCSTRDASGQITADACVQVLDRCDRPWTLLKQIRCALKPGDLLLLAVVRPVIRLSLWW